MVRNTKFKKILASNSDKWDESDFLFLSQIFREEKHLKRKKTKRKITNQNFYGKQRGTVVLEMMGTFWKIGGRWDHLVGNPSLKWTEEDGCKHGSSPGRKRSRGRKGQLGQLTACLVREPHYDHPAGWFLHTKWPSARGMVGKLVKLYLRIL